MLPLPETKWPAELVPIRSVPDERLVESGHRGGLATAKRRTDRAGLRPSDGPFPRWEYRRKMYLRRKLVLSRSEK
jgi:hypothetical protein